MGFTPSVTAHNAIRSAQGLGFAVKGLEFRDTPVHLALSKGLRIRVQGVGFGGEGITGVY